MIKFKLLLNMSKVQKPVKLKRINNTEDESFMKFLNHNTYYLGSAGMGDY